MLQLKFIFKVLFCILLKVDTFTALLAMLNADHINEQQLCRKRDLQRRLHPLFVFCVCVCYSSPNISDQRVSISKLVRINEGRTARLKCYTQNVPNVTVSVFQLSSNIDNSMLNRVHFSIQSNFNLWVVWHGVLF